MGANENAITRTPWIQTLHDYVKPYWDHLLNGPWAEGIAQGKLTLSEMQGWMLQIYPFIHVFPKYLAETLIKVQDDYSRNYYINNIRVEKAHADHWVWMGTGFGVPREEMISLANGHKPMLRDVQSLSDWLWFINTKGSLAEAAAATSFAIEGMAGDIARKITIGFQHYKDEPGVDLSAKTYRWMREHAHYDDEHPKIALEIVERYATNEETQLRVMFAAKRSLELLDHALITSYQAYSNRAPRAAEMVKSVPERRRTHAAIAFPDRRFRNECGLPLGLAA